MEAIFNSVESEPPNLVNSNIGSLLFADDLLVISESKEGLQNSINKLSDFCDNWQLTVNVKKNKKTMVLQQRNINSNTSFINFKGNMIQNVSEYKFLGSLIKSNGNLNPSLEDLAKKAQKVLCSIKSRVASLGNIPIKASNNLFDKLVQSVLTYNAEISFMDSYLTYYRAKRRAEISNKEIDNFTFIDKTPCERIHLNFCKFTIGAKKTSSNIGVRAELGRLPMEHFIMTQSILYLARLHTDNVNPLLKETLILSKSLDSQGTYSWFTFVKNITSDQNIFDKTSNCKNLKEVKSLKPFIKRELKNKYKQMCENKIKSFNENSKMFLYKKLKLNLEREFYFNII